MYTNGKNISATIGLPDGHTMHRTNGLSGLSDMTSIYSINVTNQLNIIHNHAVIFPTP